MPGLSFPSVAPRDDAETLSAAQMTLNRTLLDSATQGNLFLLQESLRAGADPLAHTGANALAHKKTACGPNALILATRHGHQDCVEALLQAAPQAALARDTDGNSALMMAIDKQLPSIADLLFPFSDLNHRDNYGMSLLMCAAMQDDAASLTRLLPHNDPLYRTCGSSALMFAAERGCLRSLQLLLPVSDLFARNDDENRTALELAAKAGHEPCVRVLLRALLAHPHASDPNWAQEVQTILDNSMKIAVFDGHWPCADWLSLHAQPEVMEHAFRLGGPKHLPRWAARRERQALACSLSPSATDLPSPSASLVSSHDTVAASRGTNASATTASPQVSVRAPSKRRI